MELESWGLGGEHSRLTEFRSSEQVAQSNSSSAAYAGPSRRERFYGGYTWLVVKNLIGWALILAALVAGPLVPGPGGIPLFIIGFALISFPGKRKLTARILRGRTLAVGGRAIKLSLLVVSLATPGIALPLLHSRVDWFAGGWVYRALSLTAGYLCGVFLTALAAGAAILVMNAMLRLMPRIRRRVRPWLRHHHIRLLPPRYRRRMPNESGIGPVRLKDEILAFVGRRRVKAGRRPHG